MRWITPLSTIIFRRRFTLLSWSPILCEISLLLICGFSLISSKIIFIWSFSGRFWSDTVFSCPSSNNLASDTAHRYLVVLGGGVEPKLLDRINAKDGGEWCKRLGRPITCPSPKRHIKDTKKYDPAQRVDSFIYHNEKEFQTSKSSKWQRGRRIVSYLTDIFDTIQ